MEYKDIIQIFLTILSILISAFISILIYKNNKILGMYQIKDMIIKNIPYPIIKSITFDKCDFNNTIDYSKHCRFYFESQISDISLNNAITATELKLSSKDDENFIKECQKNCNSVYFTYFKGYRCLILNSIDKKENFIMEHFGNKVTLHNYGSLINGMKINKVDIYKDNRFITINGSNNEFIPCIIESNNEISFALNDITTDFKNSIGRLDKPTYDSLPRR